MADEQTTTNDNPIEETVQPSTVLGSGSDNQDWRSSLPDELKNDATLQNFKDVESLAKTVVHQQKVLGSRIPIPKTDEEKSELYTKLGRPESGEAYDFTIPDTHKSHFNEDQVKEFRNVAHQIGLNNEQTKALIDFQVKSVDHEIQRQSTDLTVTKQATEDTLKKEWGYDYDKQVRNAQRALQVYGNEELNELMNGEAGNIPAVIKLFAKLGSEVTEDMAKNTQNNSLATSPLDAQSEIDNIFSDPKDAYHDNMHKDHTNRVEYMRQLHEKRFGK
jgi:uncharacterized protein YdcH (DUF465 family)